MTCPKDRVCLMGEHNFSGQWKGFPRRAVCDHHKELSGPHQDPHKEGPGTGNRDRGPSYNFSPRLSSSPHHCPLTAAAPDGRMENLWGE